MKTPESIRHLRIAIILVLSVLVLGTIGYMLIELFFNPIITIQSCAGSEPYYRRHDGHRGKYDTTAF